GRVHDEAGPVLAVAGGVYFAAGPDRVWGRGCLRAPPPPGPAVLGAGTGGVRGIDDGGLPAAATEPGAGLRSPAGRLDLPRRAERVLLLPADLQRRPRLGPLASVAP